MEIMINAQNQDQAKRAAKLDENLGPDIVITNVKTLRRPKKGIQDGLYRITYHD